MLKVFYRAALYFYLVMCLSSYLFAQKAALQELRDSAQFKISGTLLLKHRGYSSYLVIKMDSSCRAIFDATDQRLVHEIGLSLRGQSDKLKQHLGERITAEGKLVLEPVSPYYYNGVALQAEAVHLPGGNILPARDTEQVAPILPSETKQYYAKVIFQPSIAKFTYQAWNLDRHALTPAQDYLSCSLNGSGELLNCYCAAADFEAIKAGNIQSEKFAESDSLIPFIRDESPHPYFAQFELPERVKEKVEHAVLCARISVNKK